MILKKLNKKITRKKQAKYLVYVECNGRISGKFKNVPTYVSPITIQSSLSSILSFLQSEDEAEEDGDQAEENQGSQTNSSSDDDDDIDNDDDLAENQAGIYSGRGFNAFFPDST